MTHFSNHLNKTPSRINPFSVFAFLGVSCMAGALFWVSQSASDYESSISAMNRNLLNERQAIRVLEAEWAYLSRPQRIEELVALRRAEDPDATSRPSTRVINAASKVQVYEPPMAQLVSAVQPQPALKLEPVSAVIVSAPEVAKPAAAKEVKSAPVAAPAPVTAAAQPEPVKTEPEKAEPAKAESAAVKAPAPQARPRPVAKAQTARAPAQAVTKAAPAQKTASTSAKPVQKDVDVWPIQSRAVVNKKPVKPDDSMYRQASASMPLPAGRMRPIVE